ECPRRFDRLNTQALVADYLLHTGGEPIRAQPQVDESGAGNLWLFQHVAKLEALDDHFGDGARRLPQDLGQGHRTIRLIIAMPGVLSRLDKESVRRRIVDKAGEGSVKFALKLFEQIHEVRIALRSTKASSADRIE